MNLSVLKRLCLRSSTPEACGMSAEQLAARVDSDHAEALQEDASRERASRVYAQALANQASDELFWRRGLS